MSMTLPMARDLGKRGIRVNCILPGVFDTPMTAPLRLAWPWARECRATVLLADRSSSNTLPIMIFRCFSDFQVALEKHFVGHRRASWEGNVLPVVMIYCVSLGVFRSRWLNTKAGDNCPCTLNPKP